MTALDHITPAARFLRTTHVGRDYDERDALVGYVPTPHVLATIGRLAEAARTDSRGRAWRVTGDYGSGKSSLGLALARTFSGDPSGVPQEILQQCRSALGGASLPELLPVLVTGNREPLAQAIVRGLSAARSRAGLDVSHAPDSGSVSDTTAAAYLEETWREVSNVGEADGVLLIVDELGKLLEHAALNPDRHDIQLLQTIAELADRSGSAPLLVVGLLHQGFSAYAESLTRTAQEEWEKVAGRYNEIVFRHPLEETAHLAGRAIGSDSKCLDTETAEVARSAMEDAVRLGWYGPGVSRASLVEAAPALYPLHPMALPVLVRTIRLYGQNERTLFSFLLAPEPHALSEFAADAGEGEFYGLADLYDFVATAFGHRISARSARSHWAAISTLVDTIDATAEQLAVLKAIGLLNLLTTDRYLATDDTLAAAFAGSDFDVREVTDSLLARGALFHRGARGGYCLWPHSSVDLEAEFRKALEVVQLPVHVGNQLVEVLDPTPIVARRHYIETGTLRTIEVRYTTVDANDVRTLGPIEGDGLLLVLLTDTEQERTAALDAAREIRSQGTVAVVTRPLAGLRNVLHEVDAWRYVVRNTPGLAADTYAAEEASRQVEAARAALNRRLDGALGFTQRKGVPDANWFYGGEPVAITTSRQALAFLSKVCSGVYDAAPLVSNELINRDAPSSAAVAARTRLIERILTSSRQPSLDFESKAFPPEKAIYLSVLQKGGLHREVDGVLGLHLPDPDTDPANLRPVFERLRSILEENDLAKVSIDALLDDLSKPPYGVREGLAHLLLALFYRIHERDVALYEDGVFVHRPSPEHFQRLAKAPNRFALQLCHVEGVRSDLFDQLLSLVEVEREATDTLAVLDVVRPLAVFAAALPEHAQRTRMLSGTAQNVRSALLEAREPAPLLFEDLPEACGVSLDGTSQTTEAFVDALRAAIDELRAATPKLRDRVRHQLGDVFELGEAFDDAHRRTLAARAGAVLGAVRDRDLRAFAGRLADTKLPLDRWVDAVASLVVTKPLERWIDDDEAQFHTELSRSGSHFLRTEATVFAMAGEGDGAPALGAVRVGVTEADGTETMRVLVIREGDAARMDDLVSEAAAELRRKSPTERIAFVRALGHVLTEGAPRQGDTE